MLSMFYICDFNILFILYISNSEYSEDGMNMGKFTRWTILYMSMDLPNVFASYFFCFLFMLLKFVVT
jgi:cytochrome c biogenesis protein ResB